MDWTRKKDLEMLAEAMKEARTTGERERYEKMMYKMLNTSVPIQSLREDLVRAMRHNDLDRIRKIQNHIHAVRQQETNYKSWGNVRAEGVDKRE